MTGTASTSCARPLKGRRNAPVSLVVSVPQIMTSGRSALSANRPWLPPDRAAAVFIVAAVEPYLGAFRRRCRRYGPCEILQPRRPVDLRQAALESRAARGPARRSARPRWRSPAFCCWWRPGRRGSGRSSSPRVVLENQAAMLLAGARNPAPRSIIGAPSCARLGPITASAVWLLRGRGRPERRA